MSVTVVIYMGLSFWWFFLSKIEILPFGLWFPCAGHDLAPPIGHQGCFEENFMDHLKYQCIYPPFIQLLRPAFTDVVKWRQRMAVLGWAAQETCCARSCAMLPWVWLAAGFPWLGQALGEFSLLPWQISSALVKSFFPPLPPWT